jgi:heterodisulfide reductase subunit C
MSNELELPIINLDAVDRSIIEKIKENEPTFKLCMNCGGCTATCRTAGLTDYSPRRINIMLSRGMFEEVKEMIRRCQFCGRCEQLCPRGVKIRNVYLQIRSYLK